VKSMKTVSIITICAGFVVIILTCILPTDS